MPRHWPRYCKSIGLIFWSRDHKDIPIESIEINSHSNPWLPIDANQIKWFKIHILFLDFDWCPIEVMFTLHFKWTSIGSLGWIAWPPCKASILRRGWVEKNTHSPHDSNSESFQWPTELHILFHFGAMNILEFLYLEIKPLTPWAWSSVLIHHKSHAHPWFLRDLLMCQVATSHTIILGFHIIDTL